MTSSDETTAPSLSRSIQTNTILSTFKETWMKRMCFIMMLTLGLATMVSAQTRRANSRPAGPAAAPAETALKSMEHQLNDALKGKDRVALLRLLDDQYPFTDDEGRVFNKNQYIEAAVSTINVESYR